MPEFHHDPITGDEILRAPERGTRPNAHGSQTAHGPCPFCPGNEQQTPPEVDAERDPGSKRDGPGWRVRVFPNKFAAVDAPFGVHEVIVDSPDHDAEITLDSLRMYRTRLSYHAGDPRNRYAVLFKNYGKQAGASIPHPHAQLVSLTFEPARNVASATGLRRYYETTGHCAVCDEVAHANGETPVFENALTATYSRPFARFAEEFRIAPKTHAPFYGDASDGDVAALFENITALLGGLRELHDDLSFTLIFAPGLRADARHVAATHWYADLIVRASRLGGLELASGVYVNSADPKESAERLRHMVSSHA